MPILTSCQCGKSLRAPDDFAGRSVRCPACGAIMRIPHGHETADEQNIYELDGSDLYREDGGHGDEVTFEASRQSDLHHKAAIHTGMRPRILTDSAAGHDEIDPRQVRRVMAMMLTAVLVLLLIGGAWVGWLLFGATPAVLTGKTPPARKTKNVGYLDLLANARQKGKALIGGSNMRQLLIGIQQFEMTYDRYPQSLNDLVDHMPEFRSMLVNPRTGASPGFVYVQPSPGAKPSTPVLYEGAAGQIDPDGSVGYLDGHIDVKLPQPQEGP